MAKAMGEIIRALRKERGWTQEELAALLNLSGQTVSKWENRVTMPDMAQIVPLSRIFGVPTDVLFDVQGVKDDDAVREILRHADGMLYDENGLPHPTGLYRAYRAGREGLSRYPTHPWLLLYCLEKGLALAYPENDCYDPLHGQEIYQECVRLGEIMASHGKVTGDLLRTHQILLLHSAYGQFAQAQHHVEAFPERADMTRHRALAYMAQLNQEPKSASRHWQWETFYHVEALLDGLACHAMVCEADDRLPEALTLVETAISLIDGMCGAEIHRPPLHQREMGDLYVLAAEMCVRLQALPKALDFLGKTVSYELAMRSQDGYPMTTPVFGDVTTYRTLGTARTPTGHLSILLERLTAPVFAPLAGFEGYTTLVLQVRDALASTK